MTVALQISLFFVLAEFFTDFYNETSHSASMRYLYFGLGGLSALAPWIWTALAMNVAAVVILSIHPLRRSPRLLGVACVLVFAGIWIEKGMGLVVPGFIPTPLGEIFEYAPTLREVLVSLGIWALGAIVLTVLAKASVAIEQGKVRAASAAARADAAATSSPA
jgi:molybdopterin-containing oxidoreductase family membrane subunit